MLGGATGEEAQIESVTLRLANLEITITARVTGGEVSSIAGGFELVSEPHTPAGRGLSGSSSHPDFDRALENRALSATTIRSLESLPLHFLDTFIGRLRPSGSEWTPKARLARAFQCGVAAGRRLAGEYSEFAAQSIPLRNTVYVVLRAPELEPFWTASYSVYISAVGSRDPRGGSDFHRDSVSHAFPSKAEAEGYCVGARQPWPQER